MTSAYRIVVGFDGSPAGERALRWAVREAIAHRGSVHAVTAFGFLNLDGSSIRYRSTERRAVDHRVTALRAAIQAEFPDAPITGEVIAGGVAEVLVTASEGARMLVLGSHGHRPLIGSIAAHCLRRAGCPVVVMPAPVPAPAAPAAPTETGMPAALL